MNNEETVLDELWYQDGWNREIIQKHDGYTLRYKIHIDFYDFQSKATAEVWSPHELKWNQLHFIPGKRLILDDKFPTRTGTANPDHFNEALDELKDVAYRTLGCIS
jgi:hypothetical protein